MNRFEIKIEFITKVWCKISNFFCTSPFFSSICLVYLGTEQDTSSLIAPGRHVPWSTWPRKYSRSRLSRREHLSPAKKKGAHKLSRLTHAQWAAGAMQFGCRRRRCTVKKEEARATDSSPSLVSPGHPLDRGVSLDGIPMRERVFCNVAGISEDCPIELTNLNLDSNLNNDR